MSGAGIKGIGIALVSALALAGCDVAGIGGSGDGAPVNIQIVHPAQVVMDVMSVRSDGERTLVKIRVLNGREREVRLTQGKDRSYVLTDGGEKLLLVPSPTNADLAVPPGKAMDGVLVFAGGLPGSGKATLVLNDSGSRDSQYSSTPRFEVELPLAGARGGGAIPEASSLSNMVSLPQSRLGPAQGGGSTLAPSGNASSSLQAVEKLKSELGAVESERGTVVSLPGDVTFDFDKASLRGEGRTTLDRLAELIAAAGGSGQISIEGHTDAKGDDAYNKRLSEQRAEAVKAYLVEKGVTTDRLKTIGLGELRPVAPNAKPDGSDDEEGRQRNRRVEVILPKAAPQPANTGATPQQKAN